jgi:hypothetical protein
VSFRPADEDIMALVHELIGLPEDVTLWADDAGAGRFQLQPAAQWGPTAPGTWAIRFTGDVSGPIQQAVTIDIECRC